MNLNISPLFRQVNKYAVLTAAPHINKFAYMRYGERLKLARGDRTQEWLAGEAKVSQSLIWQLENSQTAKGSQYTARFARVLGVSVDWLADEIGEMIPTVYSTSDPKLVEILQALETRADYLKTAALQAVRTTCDLVDQAKANGAAANEKTTAKPAPTRIQGHATSKMPGLPFHYKPGESTPRKPSRKKNGGDDK